MSEKGLYIENHTHESPNKIHFSNLEVKAQKFQKYSYGLHYTDVSLSRMFTSDSDWQYKKIR